MAILTTSNVGQSFGAFDLFYGVSVGIPNDGKVGLVGPNGIGKTTLLLILAGRAQPAVGNIHLAKGARIGYLHQESARAFADPQRTVYAEMLTLFAGLRAEEDRLREMEAAMAEGDFSDALFAEYSRAQEQFELAGGYDYELRIQQVLDGLGFNQENWDLPLEHLSGGQKTRVLLARLLLDRPDLLILDEPTNHLDVAAIEWLENTLHQWDGAVLVVSHDRYFLDRVVNTIWEMGRSGIETYRGNYTAYLQQRQDRWDRREQAFVAYKERMEKELDYIRRNIAGQRTAMAKGKLKRITRELKAVELLGINGVLGKSWSQITNEVDISGDDWGVADAAQAIKALQPPAGRPPQLNLRLEPDRRSGHIVLRTSDLVVGYPGHPLFLADDIELTRVECAALIGPNGTGKTTFLRTILGDHEPLSGKLRLGASLELGYFAQAHEGLNPDNTVLDELLNMQNMPLSKARSYLAQYLFRGDDVYKPVRLLSGGERGRLALALLAWQDANFLLLDEPTNHLDIPAQEVLQEVLENFAGTILLVSHDRYLVDRLATQIWELRDGRLHVFGGSYQEFLALHAAEKVAAKAEASAARLESSRDNGRKLSKNEARKLRDRFTQVEQEVHELEDTLAALATAMQEATVDEAFDKIQRISLEYAAAETRLAELMKIWEELAHAQTLAG
jgi:ATP-binding cassette subfamily F protein 3